MGAAPQRIGRAPKPDQAIPNRQRNDPAWRAWYNTKRWRDLKQEVHVRDDYTCQMCGRICAGKYPADDSPTADHRKAHRGNETLFFDPLNVWTLCKFPCHDKVKQAEEQESLKLKGVWD